MSDVNEEIVPEDMVQLDLNRLLAAIVKNIGTVAVPMRDVLSDYNEYSLSVSLDDTSNMLILSLIHNNEINQEEVNSNES